MKMFLKCIKTSNNYKNLYYSTKCFGNINKIHYFQRNEKNKINTNLVIKLKKSFGDSNNCNNNTESQKSKTSLMKAIFSTEELKIKLKEYGQLGMIIYFGISITTLTTFYYLFKSKKIDAEKFIENLQDYGFNKFVDLEKLKKLANTEGASFGLAVICNKLILIFRLPLTLLLLFLIKKYLKK